MNKTIDCSQEKRTSLDRSLKKKKMEMMDDLKRISEAREFQQSRVSQQSRDSKYQTNPEKRLRP